jgi:hypothetical protein
MKGSVGREEQTRGRCICPLATIHVEQVKVTVQQSLVPNKGQNPWVEMPLSGPGQSWGSGHLLVCYWLTHCLPQRSGCCGGLPPPQVLHSEKTVVCEPLRSENLKGWGLEVDPGQRWHLSLKQHLPVPGS